MQGLCLRIALNKRVTCEKTNCVIQVLTFAWRIMLSIPLKTSALISKPPVLKN